LQPQFPDFFIGVIDWFKLKGCQAFFDEPGDHAGEMETSLMQYLYPDITKLEDAGDGNSTGFSLECMKAGFIWTPRNWSKVSTDTGIGNPRLSTPEKGKQCYEFITQLIADALVELSEVKPGDIYE